VLAVISTPVDPVARALRSDGKSGRWVELPDRSGRPRIVVAEDGRLTVTDTTGTRRLFDVASGSLTGRQP
jgi:hypothetical protein